MKSEGSERSEESEKSEKAEPSESGTLTLTLTHRRSEEADKERPIDENARGGKGAPPAAAPLSAVPKSDFMGPFWFEASRTVVDERGQVQHRGMTSKERQLLRELLKSERISETMLSDLVVPLNDETSALPRLRAYDWAVTNYAKGRPQVEVGSDAKGRTVLVDPNLDYEGELARHHRLLFDPFRRGNHLFFELGDGKIHHTTVGQLNFLCWCVSNDIHKYVEANLESIRAHMAAAARTKGQTPVGKKRRRELTAAPTRYTRGSLMEVFDIVTDANDCAEGSAGAGSVTVLASSDDADLLPAHCTL
jgi:hypothetical protein